MSSEAAAYAAVDAPTTTGTNDWDTFNTSATNWDTAFKNLIDARAELDIAVRYFA